MEDKKEQVTFTTVGNLLTKVIIPDGVTEVTIPERITVISKNTFINQKNLESVILPDSITMIGGGAFKNCYNLDDVILPEGLTVLRNEAFYNCSSLRKIALPKSLTTIEENVFASCDDLEKIVVNKNNPVYDSRENCNAVIETKSNTLVVGCKGTIITDTIEVIGKYAFYNCENLESIVIPFNVKEIKEGAFINCYDLTFVKINSPAIYKKLTAMDCCGYLIENAKTIKVPKYIVDKIENEYMNNESKYTKELQGNYYTFTVCEDYYYDEDDDYDYYDDEDDEDDDYDDYEY